MYESHNDVTLLNAGFQCFFAPKSVYSFPVSAVTWNFPKYLHIHSLPMWWRFGVSLMSFCILCVLYYYKSGSTFMFTTLLPCFPANVPQVDGWKQSKSSKQQCLSAAAVIPDQPNRILIIINHISPFTYSNWSLQSECLIGGVGSKLFQFLCMSSMLSDFRQ